MNLLVVDADQLDRETLYRLTIDRDAAYEGPLTSDTLTHLAGIARGREKRNAERLAAMGIS